jgi:hypothetical protein
MAYSSLLENLDRFSAKSVLKGSKGSIFGFIGTLVVIIVFLIVYVGPIDSFVKGIYFQSDFISNEKIV